MKPATTTCGFVVLFGPLGSSVEFAMPPQATTALDTVPLRNAKARLTGGESRVQKVNLSAGAVLDLARKAASLEVKQMADDMDISDSLVHRGLKDADHLSFHRLWLLPDAFWMELLILVANAKCVARVKRQVILDMERVG